MKHKQLTFNCLFTLILSLFFTTTFTVNAQDYNTYGLRLAFNSSNVFTQVPDETNKKADFAIAGFYKMHLTEELIYLQTELGLSRKGVRMRLNNMPYTLSHNYIEAPVFLSIGQKNISFVEIGGYFSYLVHSELSNSDFLNLNANDMNRLDYGIALGLNANYENFAIGLRYYYGLADTVSGSMSELLGEQSRNSTFQIYITYTFL